MVPEPLPLRRASRSPPLASGRCRPWPHSVLTRVSPRYPQQGGGLLRRYSPFRHSGGKNIAIKATLVRLACLIHAASVRSEPESNSHSRNCAARGSPLSDVFGFVRHVALIRHIPSKSEGRLLLCFLTSKNNRFAREGHAFPCKSVLSRISNHFRRVNNFFQIF